MFARTLSILPRGGTLTPEQWRSRHRLLVMALALHIPVLGLVGLIDGEPTLHIVAELVPVVALIALATRRTISPVVREGLVAVAFLVCSALLIHLVGGSTEAHFHFFVVLPLVALYQRWTPLLLAIGFVVVHHLVMATAAPMQLFNTQIAQDNPFVFVIVHAVFVLLAIAVLVAFWKLAEDAVLETERTNQERAAEAERALTERIRLQAETSALVRELVGASERADHHVAEVAEAVSRLSASVGSVSSEAEASAEVADASTAVTERGASTATRLLGSTAEIGGIVTFIIRVAEQTNLLALNATIEAAGAGDAGRGFGVVATEVKELARQTESATADISSRMDRIVEDARAAADVLTELRTVFGDIAQRQHRISDAVSEQLAAAHGIGDNAIQVTVAVGGMSDGIGALASAVGADNEDTVAAV